MDSLTELANIVDGQRVLPPGAVAERATSYWNSAPMQARALVMPSTTGEVAAILRACNEAGQSLITQGGLTNCVEAVEPTSNDVVLSTEKMTGIVEIDHVGGTAVVEAGAVLQTVQETVAAEGLYFPLDLGARGSCTIGGNIATNAGGINVLKYGMMRNLVLGLETVLADGTVVSSMNRMLKNNAGYDTKQLFIGSEGSLGIVTHAVLRLFPLPQSRQDALVGLMSFDNVVALLARLKSELAGGLGLHELADTHVALPDGYLFQTAIFAMLMSAPRYDGLPDDLRAVVDRHSWAWFGDVVTTMWSEAGAPVRTAALERGNAVTTLSEAEAAKIKAAVAPVRDDWIADMEKRGIDGRALVEHAQSLLREAV